MYLILNTSLKEKWDTNAIFELTLLVMPTLIWVQHSRSELNLFFFFRGQKLTWCIVCDEVRCRWYFDTVNLRPRKQCAACIFLSRLSFQSIGLPEQNLLNRLTDYAFPYSPLFHHRYSLSYIPFARRMVSDLMVKFCDTELWAETGYF